MDREDPAKSPTEKPTTTHFLLFKYTETGLNVVGDQARRARRAFELVRASDGTCSFYLTIGGCYDMVSVVTGLDEVGIARLVLAIDTLGAVRTTVLTGLRFRADQWAYFLGTLPAPYDPSKEP
ncbi:MAG: GYD domain-containing protein [Candidatus Rokubacteria bacterium]|nr:GYD domain-containing protein [Candidatus Rokubacteria bacterium]MBI3108807.1 GYD domain-containing protein [Candidatus Rokubacteria bacterium]